MSPVLSKTMLAVARSCFGFQNTFQTVTLLNGSFTKRNLGMIGFIHGIFGLPPGLVSRSFLSLLADFVVSQLQLKNASMQGFHFASGKSYPGYQTLSKRKRVWYPG